MRCGVAARARLSPPSPSGGDLFSLCASECFDFDGGVGPGGGARRGVGGNACLSILFFIWAGTPPPPRPPPSSVCVCVVWCAVRARAAACKQRGWKQKKNQAGARGLARLALIFSFGGLSARGRGVGAHTHSTHRIHHMATHPPAFYAKVAAICFLVRVWRSRERREERAEGRKCVSPSNLLFSSFRSLSLFLSRPAAPWRPS